ncbi:MAG: DNA/RNA helicase domain-containing protein [Thermoanaerobaculia bacterium]
MKDEGRKPDRESGDPRRKLKAAREIAERLREQGFPIHVTHDLAAARDYVRERFGGEPDRRYGILASSKAKNLGEFGLDPSFQATKKIQVGKWFNDGPQSARSCCRLDTVITEFQCQGLELDLSIVCWGDDFWWEEGGWRMRKTRAQALVRDPFRLRRNAYRVLLTRGREGLVIVVPREPGREMGAIVRGGALELQRSLTKLATWGSEQMDRKWTSPSQDLFTSSFEFGTRRNPLF